jgi:hypothetical protein
LKPVAIVSTPARHRRHSNIDRQRIAAVRASPEDADDRSFRTYFYRGVLGTNLSE